MNLTLILFGRTVVDFRANEAVTAPVPDAQPVAGAVVEPDRPSIGGTSHFGFSHAGTWRRPVVK